MFTKADWLKNLQIENWSLSSQRWLLHGFQTSHFICSLFGCKLWLLSIQNHSLNCFQAFAPQHLNNYSKVAVLFNSNLSRHPFFIQVVNLDLLLCTGFSSEHDVLFLCHIFTERPMTDRKIKQRNGCCFGLQQPVADSIENFISHEK